MWDLSSVALAKEDEEGMRSEVARIPHLTPSTLSRDLRQYPGNKVFHAIHAKVTGETMGDCQNSGARRPNIGALG